MNYKYIGGTSFRLPEVGLGTWNYKGGVEPLRAGIGEGASLIDTAEGYHTEDVVGDAVRNIRDKVILATKVSGRNLGYYDLLESAEKSLEKLGTDIIDLYQIHWPNPAYPINETMKAMQKLLDEGLVRFVGVSNFNIEEIKEAQYYLSHYKIISNQVLYNLNSRKIEKDMLPYCIENDITVLAYTPLDSGVLCTEPADTGKEKYKVLSDISEEVGKTIAQVALNWCICHENVVVIPKSDSVNRTVENCGSSGWYLTPDQVRRLDKAFSI